jgi:diguanylate cyclase (GGDEF)-like protein
VAVELTDLGDALANPITEARMFAALVATNEAIIRSNDRDEALQRVCSAALEHVGFIAAAVLLAGPDQSLTFAAGAGDGIEVMKGVQISTAESTLNGQGLAGIAFRTCRPTVSNDYLNDERTRPWRAMGAEYGIAAAAAFPILDQEKSRGILLVYSPIPGSIDQALINILERMTENISYALRAFDRNSLGEKQRRAAQRLTQMFGALSATNETLLRARTPDEMFQNVCEAAAAGGQPLGAAAVFLMQPGSEWLVLKAAAGNDVDLIKQMPLSMNPANKFGGGLHGPALREGRPFVSYDTLSDPRTQPWIVSHAPPHGCAALPLRQGGRPVGILFFFFGQSAGQQRQEIEALMSRIADNMSFALDMFDHDAHRIRSERMFAALSATNEAIFRSQNVDEMLRLVCEASVNEGKYLSTAISLVEADSPELKVTSAAGAFIDAISQMQISTDPDDIRGQGLSGTAFRTGAPCISNDVMKDPRLVSWHPLYTTMGACSAAALPLIKNKVTVGLMHFLFGSDVGTIDDLMLGLMSRLAENVSFGLDTLERKANSIRLTRMFASLSATNEAIMRATNRAELFSMVCAASVEGAKFTTATILLDEPEGDHFSIAGCAGPNESFIRQLRHSPKSELPEGQGIVGSAFRSGMPAVANDYQSDQRTRHWHTQSRASGARSGAALPLLSHGRPIGVLLFMSLEANIFTQELVELLQRLAENVSFALENLERAEENRLAERQIRYLATHDGLTRLPNRVKFNHHLAATIETANANGSEFAVMFIDLDRFKIINDSLGHAAGDELLIEMARRLRASLSETDVVARLGGDEFVVILKAVSGREQVSAVARSVMSALSKPLTIGDHEYLATASIGISMFPSDGNDETTLMKHADLAMYQAKEEGKNDFRFFVRGARTQSVERLMLETSLRHALELGQFAVHYQPKVDMTTQQVTGVEALLRWSHPKMGDISPAKFIPLAEETGLIIPIGRWVLRTACLQNVAWQRQGVAPISVAVNLSPRQFLDTNLLVSLDEILAESGMRPELLQLEITESMVMLNVERAVELLDAIQSRGVRLAIDDFGTGYSSMSMMKRFPIDTIKIDRSFIKDIPDDSEDKAITEAIIQMGKALGLTVVAEGVETEEQRAFLRLHGCDEMQGFLFSKARLPEDIPALVAQSLQPSPPLQPALIDASLSFGPETAEAG